MTTDDATDRESFPSPQTRDYRANCAGFEPVHRPHPDRLLHEYTEFTELAGRGVKIRPSTASPFPAVTIALGTDADLIDLVARDLGIGMDTARTFVALLSNAAILCPDMARETIRMLQTFLDEHPLCDPDEHGGPPMMAAPGAE